MLSYLSWRIPRRSHGCHPMPTLPRMTLKPNDPPPNVLVTKERLLDDWCRTLALDFLGPSTSLSPLCAHFLVCEVGVVPLASEVRDRWSCDWLQNWAWSQRWRVEGAVRGGPRLPSHSPSSSRECDLSTEMEIEPQTPPPNSLCWEWRKFPFKDCFHFGV